MTVESDAAPPAAPKHRRDSRFGIVIAVVFVVVLTAILLAIVTRNASAAFPGDPGTYGWQFQDLDGPGVPGGNGRSTQPMQDDGSATIRYEGVPHVFYRSGGELRHAWAPPSGWLFETLDGDGGPDGRTSHTVGGGASATLFNGEPHVFYVDATANRLRHAWYSVRVGRWFFEDLDGTGVPDGNGRTNLPVGGRSSVVIWNGQPHVFYSETSLKDLRHAWWNGSRWQFETLDGAGGTNGRVDSDLGAQFAAVAVSTAPNTLQVFYQDLWSQRLRQAAYNTAAFRWEFANLDGPGVAGGNGRETVPTGLQPAVVEFDRQPHVFYGDDEARLRHGWINSQGQWFFETVPAPPGCDGCEPGTAPSATLYTPLPGQRPPLPVVAHHDARNKQLLFSRFAVGTGWVTEALDGPGVPGGAGRTADEVGLSSSIVQYGLQLSIAHLDSERSRLRQAWYGPAPPVNVVEPELIGAAKIGEPLAAYIEPGWFTNEPASYSYQWQRCTAPFVCTDIAGATDEEYELTADDVGQLITVRVTATNRWGSGSATPLPLGPVRGDLNVVSVEPNSGTIAGGTVVTIFGGDFSEVTSVTIGGVEATILSVDADTIVVSTPASATPGEVDVTVTTPTATATLTDGFVYEGPPAVDGQLQWAQRAGGADNGVESDASGNVVSTGYFGGTQTFGAGGSTATLTSAGQLDVYVVKYDPSGGVIWAAQIGAAGGNNTGYDVALSSNGDVTVGGTLRGSATFGSGPDAVTLTSSGGRSAFVARYDASGNFVWAKSLKGADIVDLRRVAVDGSGNVYTSGDFTKSVTVGDGPGAVTLTTTGSNKAYLASFGPTGDVRWAQQISSSVSSIGYGVAVDPDGNMLATGTFDGTATFGTGGAAVTLTSRNSDVYLAKFDTDGVLQWVRQAGGTQGDRGWDVASDASGNPVVAGTFVGNITFGSGAGAVSFTSRGLIDAFIAKYDGAGTLLWADSAGGARVTETRAVKLDAAGNIFIAGSFSQGSSTFGSDTTAKGLSSIGSGTAFIAKYAPSGTALVWASKVASGSYTAAFDVGVSPAGDAVIGGLTYSNTMYCNGGDPDYATCAFGLADPLLIDPGSANGFTAYFKSVAAD